MPVTVIGNHQVAAKFRQAAAQLKSQQPLMLQHCGEVVKTSIVADIVKQGLIKEGRLVQSGRVFHITGSTTHVGFGKNLINPESGSPYIWALELGADFHPIAAKRTRNLVFFWDKIGDYFIGPRLPIGHPGVRPYRFVRQGTQAAMPEVTKVVFDSVSRALMMR